MYIIIMIKKNNFPLKRKMRLIQYTLDNEVGIIIVVVEY